MATNRATIPLLLLMLALPSWSPADAAQKETVRIGGSTVEVDPRTGRLVPPTAEQLVALRATLGALFEQASETGAATSLADGTRSVVPDERHATFFVAEVEGDGRLSTRCLAGADSIERFFAEAGSGAGREE
jgi:hypothetical protein